MDTYVKQNKLLELFIEPRHEISHNVICATSKGSDQPAHTHSLARAFASRLNKLPNEQNLEFLSLKARLSIHLSKCHIVGNHMLWLISLTFSRVVICVLYDAKASHKRSFYVSVGSRSKVWS